MKIATILLAEALEKARASEARAANTTKNAVIKDCHTKQAADYAAILAELASIKQQEVYITIQEPAAKK